MSGSTWKSLALAGLCACGQPASSTFSETASSSTTGQVQRTTGDAGSSTTGGSSTGATSTGASSTGGNTGGCPGAGSYCGGDQLSGDRDVLYHCDGAGFAPSSQTLCADGCELKQPALDDTCRAAAGSTGSGSTSTTGSSGGSTTGGSSGGSTGAARPICPGVGPYCGQDGVQNGEADVLYQCPEAGFPPSSWTACAQGCTVEPEGTPDYCGGSAIVCHGKGAYCGEDGVEGGTPGTLYQCTGQGLAPGASTACPQGCSVQPDGIPDFCISTPPLCQGPSPGAYCGSDLVVNGDANTLYQCPGPNLAPTSLQACASGCQVESQGTPDFCASSQPVCTGPSIGNYCGGDQVTNGDPETLYHGAAAGQPPDDALPCTGGCTAQPPGTDDACSVICQGANPGDYCGGDSVAGGDPSALYHCPGPGQPPDDVVPCSAGCSVQDAGTDDFCNGDGACGGPAGGALQFEAPIITGGKAGACSGTPPACYSDYCLGLVNDAFTAAGDSMPELQVYSAVDSLHAFQTSGNFYGWEGSCPCGAILFWDANACNGFDGHIAICNGDGTVSTSGWQSYAGSTNAAIAWIETQECNDEPAGYALPR